MRGWLRRQEGKECRNKGRVCNALSGDVTDVSWIWPVTGRQHKPRGAIILSGKLLSRELKLDHLGPLFL